MIFKSSYGNIYYEVYGESNPTTIMFIHGLAADNKMYKEQINFFSEEYKVIVLDLPGHGKSFPIEKSFDFDTIAKCLIELLDELGIKTTNMAGASMGGYITQFIAHKYPDRIQAIAIDGCTPLHLNLGRNIKFLARVHSFSIRLTPLFITRFIAKQILGKNKEAQKYIQNALSRLNKRKLLIISEGIKREIFKGIDSPITQPVLVTHGEHELSILKNMCKQWKDCDANIDYIEFKKTGHIVAIEKPEEYNKVAKNFFDHLN